MINMVLYESTYGDDIIGTTFFDTIFIGIGGTCTVRLQNGKVIDLIGAGINYNIRTLSGRSYRDSLIDENPVYQETLSFSLDEISEVIFEGFIITSENRDSVLQLLHEDDGINFIKIPRRD